MNLSETASWGVLCERFHSFRGPLYKHGTSQQIMSNKKGPPKIRFNTGLNLCSGILKIPKKLEFYYLFWKGHIAIGAFKGNISSRKLMGCVPF